MSKKEQIRESAIKIIASKTYKTKKERADLRKEIKKDYKNDPNGENLNTDWSVGWESTNDKSGFKGWCE
jgi:hypothetical protein